MSRRLHRAATTARRTSRHPARTPRKAQTRRRRDDETAERKATAARYRTIGGMFGQRRPFGGRILGHTRLTGLELSTAAAEAIYPFQVATQAATSAGIAIGPSTTGGTFTFDPWTWYLDKRISNPNVLVIGEIGAGKSSLVKAGLVWRGLEFGRGAHIIDPKGEYGPLADAVGVEPVKLTPGGGIVLNPLDPGAAGTQLDPRVLFHRNLATTRSLVEATLGRTATQLEMIVLGRSLATVTGRDPAGPSARRHGQVATLPMVAEALRQAPTEVAAHHRMSPEQVQADTRDLALAMARLVADDGDLGGMFSGPTNIDADPLAALTVVDIADVATSHRAALPMVMICAASWLQLATQRSHTGRWLINDEAWRLLETESTARWTQSNMKLSRQLGLSVVNVMHRLSDTQAAGDAGSATRSLAEGVIADSGTVVIYRQNRTERPLLRDRLGLNTVQTDTAMTLRQGQGLWVVNGDHRQVARVTHIRSDIEIGLTDTDVSMTASQRQQEPHDRDV